MAEFIRLFLSDMGDERKVIPDPAPKYFGAVLDQDGLSPSGQFIAGPTRSADWARASPEPVIKRRVIMQKSAVLLLAGASLLSANVAAQETTPAAKVSKVFDRELPNVPGKSMR